MSNIQNRHRLPGAIVRAVTADPYKSGKPENVPPERYYTTTTLINPIQQTILRRRHADEITEDAADLIWSLLGSVGHGILERAATTPYERIVAIGRELGQLTREIGTTPEGADVRDQVRRDVLPTLRNILPHFKPEVDAHRVLVEKRLYSTVLDGSVTIGGQLDNLDLRDGVLQDYKFTSVAAAKQDSKIEWALQNSVNAWLCEQNGYPVERAEIVAILRDWRIRDAQADPTYPQVQVQTIETPLWPAERLVPWIEERVRDLIDAYAMPDAELTECTEEERWARDSAYFVVKRGNTRAVPKSRRATKEEAEALAQELYDEALTKKKPAAFDVEYRPGISRRCSTYCNVRDVCHQYKRIVAETEAA